MSCCGKTFRKTSDNMEDRPYVYQAYTLRKEVTGKAKILFAAFSEMFLQKMRIDMFEAQEAERVSLES